MTQTLSGSCHCGNVSYSLTWPGDLTKISARRCGCTFCTKHGGIWVSNPAGALAVKVARPAQLSRYAFETGTAEFLVCARCGVPPLVTSRIEGRMYAVVNATTFDGIGPAMLSVAPASFDDELVDDRLARRQRGWIPDVTIEEGPS